MSLPRKTTALEVDVIRRSRAVDRNTAFPKYVAKVQTIMGRTIGTDVRRELMAYLIEFRWKTIDSSISEDAVIEIIARAFAERYNAPLADITAAEFETHVNAELADTNELALDKIDMIDRASRLGIKPPPSNAAIAMGAALDGSAITEGFEGFERFSAGDGGRQSLRLSKTTAEVILGVPTAVGDLHKIQKMLYAAPRVAATINYHVDSINRLTTRDPTNKNLGIQEFVFSISDNSRQSPGAILTLGKAPINIYQITVAAINLPRILAMEKYDYVFMAVNELGQLGYATSDGVNYQFKFMKQNINSTTVRLVPNGDGIFRPNTLSALPQRMSFSFYVNSTQLVFAMDRATVYFAGITIGFGTDTIFDVGFNHGLQTSDMVSINGFTTTTPAADASLITQMNTLQTITYINTTSFAVSIDTSAITIPTDIAVQILFDNKRIIINMEFGYIRDNPV